MSKKDSFLVDFHIHSHFSIATSKKLTPEHLDYWAKLKGIKVVGTGDCVHPGWLSELKEKVEPCGNGLFRLKPSYTLKDMYVPSSCAKNETLFMLTGEISSIYKKDGKVRKVHNVCVFPDFESAEKVQAKLEKVGNIRSDGRPILGLDSKILLEIVLESSDLSFLIPAHIWTPWFSLLGAKSGFNHPKECYEDLTKYIFAVETGLSSDPPMNWTCSFLDEFRLVSNSDAHSPEKLGREANIFNSEVSYKGIYDALKFDKGFLGTIEFFPQEGKYHLDGHRKCNICWDAETTIENNGICSVCRRPVTKGVMTRVKECSDRTLDDPKIPKKDFYSATGLSEIIAETLEKRSAAKIVKETYSRLINALGPELDILITKDISDIKTLGGPALAEGIKRLRTNKVHIQDGYDGEFGRIKVFAPGELQNLFSDNLFSEDIFVKKKVHMQNAKKQNQQKSPQSAKKEKLKKKEAKKHTGPNDQQLKAINFQEGQCMVIAGPGSGKTYVLTERVANLINKQKVPSENILAVTFSNQAVDEMRQRIEPKVINNKAVISTFHALGLSILRDHVDKFGRNKEFKIIKDNIIEKKKVIKKILEYKQGIRTVCDNIQEFDEYNKKLEKLNVFDLDDLIYLPVELFVKYPDILKKYQEKYQWILVDEFQDINAKQYEFITYLTGKEKANLFVIGDPDQAIYGFRGSDVKYIDKLKQDYPNMKEIRLDKSYRCPGPILKIAGQVLKKDKFLEGRESNIKIQIKECVTAKSEADFIATQIEKMIGGVRSFSINSGISDGTEYEDINSFSDFAVLCRTTGLFDLLKDSFNKHGIAYQIIGGKPFYEKEPMKSILESLSEKSNKEESIKDALCVLIENKDISDQDKANILQIAETFSNNYTEFFQGLALRNIEDEFDIKKEAVSLMTMHASKGLEFNTVFIPGCEKNIIPFELFNKKTTKELLEEERLFYVSATRSKKYLFLSHAKKRILKGRFLDQTQSPFLYRLQKDLLEITQKKFKKEAKKQLSLF